MDFEDPHRTFEPTPDACPSGCTATHCFALAGINSGEFSEQYGRIVALPVQERPEAVSAFYQGTFWNANLAAIISNEIAKRVYDSGVNQGPGNATKFLQRAINSLYHEPMVNVDGGLGPITVKQANLADPVALVAAFKAFRLAGYKQDAGWATSGAGWKIRAEA